MKVTTNRCVGFNPIEVKITLESQNEFDVLYDVLKGNTGQIDKSTYEEVINPIMEELRKY